MLSIMQQLTRWFYLKVDIVLCRQGESEMENMNPAKRHISGS